MHDPQDATPPTVPARAAGGQRSWEIDALRGLMLVLMTSTHLPTRFSDPLGQPLGFVSAAEGFVLLSGFVAGRVYTQRRLRSGEDAMREAFVKRAAKLWLCQAGLLVFLLGIVTLIGVLRNQAAITDLVSFFLDRGHKAAGVVRRIPECPVVECVNPRHLLDNTERHLRKRAEQEAAARAEAQAAVEEEAA